MKAKITVEIELPENCNDVSEEELLFIIKHNYLTTPQKYHLSRSSECLYIAEKNKEFPDRFALWESVATHHKLWANALSFTENTNYKITYEKD